MKSWDLRLQDVSAHGVSRHLDLRRSKVLRPMGFSAPMGSGDPRGSGDPVGSMSSGGRSCCGGAISCGEATFSQDFVGAGDPMGCGGFHALAIPWVAATLLIAACATPRHPGRCAGSSGGQAGKSSKNETKSII